jgi:hypothetical protein
MHNFRFFIAKVVIMADEITNFPKKGDNKKISLRNSNYRQFDYSYANKLKEDYPTIWKKGGNIRGNQAFNLWTKARQGTQTDSVIDWIKEREAWMARHYGNKNIAGVIAQVKWGGIGSRGISYMKNLINEEKKKVDNKKNLEGGVNLEKKKKEISMIVTPYIVDKEKRIVEFKASNKNFDSDNDRMMVESMKMRPGARFIDAHQSTGTVDKILGDILKGYQKGTEWMNKIQFDDPTVKASGEKVDSDILTEGAKLTERLWNWVEKGRDIKVSIGFLFNPEKAIANEKGGYDIYEAEQYELSAVIAPANVGAGLKSLNLDDNCSIKELIEKDPELSYVIEKAINKQDIPMSEIPLYDQIIKYCKGCYPKKGVRVVEMLPKSAIVNIWGDDENGRWQDKYYEMSFSVNENGEVAVDNENMVEVEAQNVWLKKEVENIMRPMLTEMVESTGIKSFMAEYKKEVAINKAKEKAKSIFKKNKVEKQTLNKKSLIRRKTC